ncbi:hypothetical protein GWI33_005494 [Rhynchophorus ferrugineus]|uniref:Uncharacterized protein n=1 Tax=Rhynchophorus ferrugineus TaxID=354439 RepID=A0A834IVV6_RHYFE|nr:hypothetical protein GWI33_005494 [Rhynchophorus ferrugineus]
MIVAGCDTPVTASPCSRVSTRCRLQLSDDFDGRSVAPSLIYRATVTKTALPPTKPPPPPSSAPSAASTAIQLLHRRYRARKQSNHVPPRDMINRAAPLQLVLLLLCEPTAALAPPPALVGYSLVGVYPCAVWQPQVQGNSTGPVRNQHHTNRPAPYPVQAVQVPVPPSNTVVQPTQVVVASCNCTNNTNSAGDVAASNKETIATPEIHTSTSTSTSTPMLFVPFSVPNFTPTIAATVTSLPNMGTPKVSLSDNGNKIMVLSASNNNSIPYVEHYKELKTAWVPTSMPVNQPTLLAVPPIITQQTSNTTVTATVQPVPTASTQINCVATVTSTTNIQSKQDTSSKSY